VLFDQLLECELDDAWDAPHAAFVPRDGDTSRLEPRSKRFLSQSEVPTKPFQVSRRHVANGYTPDMACQGLVL